MIIELEEILNFCYFLGGRFDVRKQHDTHTIYLFVIFHLAMTINDRLKLGL